MTNEQILKRMAERVDMDCDTGCWLWIAGTNKGYGAFWVDRKVAGAHRVSWVISKGGLPPSVQVLHRCDTPCCVNPEHLFIGDNRDNMADKQAKGRQVKGSTHGGAKLCEEDVITIRASKEQGTSLARRYGVRPETICSVRKGRTWAYLLTEGATKSGHATKGGSDE